MYRRQEGLNLKEAIMFFSELSETAEQGINLTLEGRYCDALDAFDKDVTFTHNPYALSCYALSLAEADGNYERAVTLGLIAVEKEFYNPEIYVNLARIFILRGQKVQAIKTLRKGLKFDPAHAGLKMELQRLGSRRRPVLAFLPRHNCLNRFLGALSHRCAA